MAWHNVAHRNWVFQSNCEGTNEVAFLSLCLSMCIRHYVCVCVCHSVGLFQLFSHHPGCLLLHWIVCTTSSTSKWAVPARTYLKINAVLDVAKKFISFTGVSLSSAHTPKYTQASTVSISVVTHRQKATLVTDLCVSSDSGSIVCLLEDQTNTHVSTFSTRHHLWFNSWSHVSIMPLHHRIFKGRGEQWEVHI